MYISKKVHLLAFLKIFLVSTLAMSFVIFFSLPALAAIQIEKIDVNSDDEDGDVGVDSSSISGDGSIIVFSSSSTNLVAGDTNGVSDIFIYDRDAGALERILAPGGAEINGTGAFSANISVDGRYVTFYTSANNLVDGDTNGVTDVFVYDRTEGTFERISVTSAGQEVAGASENPDISSDGRYVAFMSNATDLVAGDTNNVKDAFVYDRDTDTIERVSVSSGGAEADAAISGVHISGNGRYVALITAATNLVAGDENGVADVFVYDRDTDTIEMVSVDDEGGEGNGVSTAYFSPISDDGRYVVFDSTATNLVAGDTNGVTDIFVHDRENDTTERVSINDGGGEGDNTSRWASISGNGQFVTFSSTATNFADDDVLGAEDIFLYDRDTDTIKIISRHPSSGEEANDSSESPVMSSDGEEVIFHSYAMNLIDRQDAFGSPGLYLYYNAPDNNVPTDIVLSNQSIAENEAIGTVVGTLSATDADGGDIHTFTLACDVAGADDASFSIDGTNLLSAAIFDFETDASYEICIRADDGAGGTYDENFTITITDIDESVPEEESSSSSSGTRFGCADISASNYQDFVSHKQELCEYGTASATANNDCPVFNSYERFGSRNQEVLKIQSFLLGRGINPGPIDGIFGRLTEGAVKSFQSLYAFDILLPWGMERPSGWWYVTTTKKANELSGCPSQ